MASWREIERIRKDSVRFKAVAHGLLRHTAQDVLTEWEAEFLSQISEIPHIGDYTTRQGEKLLEIRDNVSPLDKVAGFSVGLLLKGCYEARLDLDPSDEEWIVSLWNRRDSLRKRDAGRLMRCARQLNIIESEGEG